MTEYNILLLTNRDSDNVGDQVIEACDIALIKAVMKNLNIDKSEYKIKSHSASIVTKQYMKIREEKYLEKARTLIKEADLVIFGGAPVFNYLYQTFYERTAITLELAQEYGKPVIFSAIGIEQYDEEDVKCQRLKKTLNFDCVKQITTRDGIEELKKYKKKEQLVIARVSDPAVFSKEIFGKYIKEKANKKKIGLFVFRSNGFKDNKIPFTKEDAAKLWKNIIKELENKGYEYTLLTSGHFNDEAFMDYLIRNHGIEESKCIFNINSPERLLEVMSTLDGVISCRLHPSIISYSLGTPSVGLVWNPKVKFFYDCIEYSERRIDITETDACGIVERLEKALQQGVNRKKEYLITVYQYLFLGIKNALHITEEAVTPYDYEQLIENISEFTGTSANEKGLKLKRKFRRSYELLNDLQKLENVEIPYTMYYHSGEKGEQIVPVEDWKEKVDGNMRRLPTGAMECTVRKMVNNDGTAIFVDNLYQNEKKRFKGWRVRFLIKDTWFWYLEDGSFCPKETYDKKINGKIKGFFPGERIPNIPLVGVNVVVAEAVWIGKICWRI